MRKTLLFILFFSFIATIYGQEADSVKFEKGVYIEPGIYTHLDQLLGNAPKYYGYRIDKEKTSDLSKKGDELACIDHNGKHLTIKDTLWAYVNNRTLFIRFKNGLVPLTMKGAISTFMVSNYMRNTGNATTVDEDIYFYYFDLKTGVINRIKKTQMDKISELFTADDEIYSEFSSLSKSKKKKLYYSYILKYNQRNPVYIKKAF